MERQKGTLNVVVKRDQWGGEQHSKINSALLFEVYRACKLNAMTTGLRAAHSLYA
jgi:hypothetical protein